MLELVIRDSQMEARLALQDAVMVLRAGHWEAVRKPSTQHEAELGKQ